MAGDQCGSYRGKICRYGLSQARQFLTLSVDWPRDFGASQHGQRAAIPTYKCSIGYSIMTHLRAAERKNPAHVSGGA
jgi:hypothetical protein